MTLNSKTNTFTPGIVMPAEKARKLWIEFSRAIWLESNDSKSCKQLKEELLEDESPEVIKAFEQRLNRKRVEEWR